MEDKEFCESCNQKESCGVIYEKIGNIKGPSVTLKVITAFLIPLLAFISSLIACDGFLNRFIVNEKLKTISSILVALIVTLIVVIVIKKRTRQKN